ncbi:polysaccharide deacetylase family protein [Sporosarcina sp. BI001-red]|uniref:polysaccharide deacetylase family protein n=1 Tax=Sporosarcina sp. BI001-red TaxID=2282866 RepID=UPI000E228E08|nr:polysaccharide deacetylase family protein [Sporosarcina sp. BI001-red]REB07270.1 polysaccharide deacetylase family protein [Sporosarcina sp. BI001-red]
MKRIGILALIASGLTIIFFTFNVFATDRGRPYYEEKGYVLWDIKTNDKVVAITFDDGPHPKYTEEILDVLEKNQAKATFFTLGQHAEKYPDIVLREFNDGHEVANHTYSHSRFKTAKQFKQELIDTNEVIYGITGTYPKLFRPVEGNYNDRLINIAVKQNFKVVMWSWHQDTEDWKKPGVNKIVEKVLTGTKPGDVILFHDGGGERSQTVQALEKILPKLKEQGYRFVTVSELMDNTNAETLH